MIKLTKGGKDVHVLVITDHFTGYVQALVTSLQSAKCTAQAFWDRFIVHYDLLERIVSDEGQNFESDLISELCKLAKVWKLHTGCYNTQTSGQWEHFNHALINMLGTLPTKRKSSCREMVLT